MHYLQYYEYEYEYEYRRYICAHRFDTISSDYMYVLVPTSRWRSGKESGLDANRASSPVIEVLVVAGGRSSSRVPVRVRIYFPVSRL